MIFPLFGVRVILQSIIILTGCIIYICKHIRRIVFSLQKRQTTEIPRVKQWIVFFMWIILTYILEYVLQNTSMTPTSSELSTIVSPSNISRHRNTSVMLVRYSINPIGLLNFLWDSMQVGAINLLNHLVESSLITINNTSMFFIDVFFHVKTIIYLSLTVIIANIISNIFSR